MFYTFLKFLLFLTRVGLRLYDILALDLTKYFFITQTVRGNTSSRMELWSEMDTSNQGSSLCLEVNTSDWSCTPSIRGLTSLQRFKTPVGDLNPNRGHTCEPTIERVTLCLCTTVQRGWSRCEADIHTCIDAFLTKVWDKKRV